MKKKLEPHCTVCQGDGYELMRRYGTLHSTGLPCPRKCKAGLRVARLQDEHEVYQVFKDMNGMVYLRVAYSNKGACYVVNKNFSVELIELERYSTMQNRLALNPVPGAGIKECARLLLHPVHDSCTISVRARQVLEEILSNKELEMKATNPNAKPVRPAAAVAGKPAKFATVTAPAVAGAKGRSAASGAGSDNLAPRAGKAAGKAQAVPKARKATAPAGDSTRQTLDEKAAIAFKIIGNGKAGVPRQTFVEAMREAFPSSYSTTAKLLEDNGFIVRTADAVTRKK